MEIINSILWIIVSLILLLGGLFYTIKLKGVQFHFRSMIKSLKINKRNKTGINPLESLSLSLASRIGVGCLSGIALAIYRGGMGTIFWILLFTIFLLPNAYMESTLGAIFHEKKDNLYVGGPTYYMEKGLKKKYLALLYGIISIMCFFFFFNAIQGNTISKFFFTYLNVPLIVSGIIISILTLIIIFGDIKRITKFTGRIVPLMGTIYIMMAFVVILFNLKYIPNILLYIVKAAFTYDSLKWGIFSSMIIAIQRSIFSSEIGIGSGAIASASSNTKDVKQEGYIQMLGIYFVIFVVCLSTAIIILTSNLEYSFYYEPNGIEIIKDAINFHYTNFGSVVLSFIVFSFSFSTIISIYYYGENNFKYVFSKFKKKSLFFVKLLFCIVILLGAIINPTYLWNLVDLGNGLLILVNTYAVFKLRKHVIGVKKMSL